MIAMINNKTKCSLGEVAGKLKTVDPDSQIIPGGKTDRYQFWRLKLPDIRQKGEEKCLTRLYTVSSVRRRKIEDVKGQEHVVTTLKNQIKADRIGHACLAVPRIRKDEDSCKDFCKSSKL